MEKAISTINQFDLTKEQINNFIEQVTSDILDSGEYDLLATARNLKVMEDIVKSIKSNISSYVIDDISKYGKTVDLANTTFTVKVRNSPDWSSCKDSTLKQLEQDLKDRKQLIQTLKKPIADAETGEIIEPVMFRSSEYYEIKIK